MKARIGFVSNSSSASFIVLDDSYNTTAKVAAEMIKIVFKDWDEWETGENFTVDDARAGQAKLALKWLEEHPDFNGNIYLPWTCNYSTYLWDHNGHPAADTCNNHYWWDHFSTESLEEELENKPPGWYFDLRDCKLKPCRYCSRY
jgi:hypothetical protein